MPSEPASTVDWCLRYRQAMERDAERFITQEGESR